MTGKAPVEIVRNQLVLGPVTVDFQRTLRIPETGVHPLPPGLGRFPLRRVADYPNTAPAEWLVRGGVMLPVYQREAMWLSFVSSEPAALQVAIGKAAAKGFGGGTARVTVNYNADGSVSGTSIAGSSGDRDLDRAATSWARGVKICAGAAGQGVLPIVLNVE